MTGRDTRSAVAEGRPAKIESAEDFAARFSVSRETTARLETYAALLRQWQPTINLVAPNTLPDLWHRHMADSAQLAVLVPHGVSRLVDLGSGAGFPGLVLAIMLMEREPAPRVTLVESDSRKAAFLAEVGRRTGAPVDILCMRIESAATRDKVGRVNVITARALAPLPKLLAFSAPLFSPGTVALFLKGREAQAELDEAARTHRFTARLVPSLTDSQAQVVVIEGVAVNTEGSFP